MPVEVRAPYFSVFPCFLVGSEKLLLGCVTKVLLNPSLSDTSSVKRSGKGRKPILMVNKLSPCKHLVMLHDLEVALHCVASVCTMGTISIHQAPFLSIQQDTQLALLLRINIRVQVAFRGSELLCSLDQGWHSQVKTKSFTLNRVKSTQWHYSSLFSCLTSNKPMEINVTGQTNTTRDE